jgi:hypothetical protein
MDMAMAPNPPVSDGGTTTPDAHGGNSNCIAMTTAKTSGNHNPGRACMQCHGPGGGAPTFTAAGTLYDALTGSTAVAGATVEIIDASGTKVSIVTSQNGNFYTSTALTFPLTVRASGCPNDQPMVSKVTNGDCNSCHNSTFHVHLP